MRRAAALLGLCVLPFAGACELTEVSLADARDVVIAEIVLRTDVAQQSAFLHRTLGTGRSGEVTGARVEIEDVTAGTVHVLAETSIELCVEDADPANPIGTCYRTIGAGFRPQPGRRYALRIRLADGSLMESETDVPGDFEIHRPTPTVCRLAVSDTIEITWSQSSGAWVYVSESELKGLREALRPRGIEVKDEPTRFIGLSIGAADTTLVFPSELGLFDRADPDLADALIAIRDGLPAGVDATVTVAAADRNYVNWARGGTFNPSGFVQVPSIRGAGTGVFGSAVVRRATLATTENAFPPCS